MNRDRLQATRRWVVKIGSALLTDDGRGLNRAGIGHWVTQIVSLLEQQVEVVLVSSGSVAEGLSRLGRTSRPDSLHELQAAAAVGQMGLVQAYESCFQQHDRHTAQILLDHDDLSNRQRYLNARNTLKTLLGWGVVPVVNENDTVVTDEIRFGDNDTLASLVANLIDADVLMILTDQDGLFDKNPSVHPDAKLVRQAVSTDDSLAVMAGESAGHLGRGGMVTKLRAARLAARSGTDTLIANGRYDNILARLYQGEALGTLLEAQTAPQTARKQWLAGQLQVRGALVLDAGAVKVLREQGKSLLPVGVKGIEGGFSRGDLVSCVAESGEEVARGLVNYSAGEAGRIMGNPSSEIVDILGYCDDEELIHRDNLVLV